MISLKKTSCVLLTPLTPEFEPIQEAIREAVQSYGKYVDLVRFDEELPDFSSIMRTIEKADLILADITGENPNVMYELGLAHGLKKPVMLVVQKEKGHVPSALRGHLFYVYEPRRSGKDLLPAIHRWLDWNLTEVGAAR